MTQLRFRLIDSEGSNSIENEVLTAEQGADATVMGLFQQRLDMLGLLPNFFQ